MAEEKVKKGSKPIDALAEGIQSYRATTGSNYRMVFPKSGNNVVNVIDRTAGRLRDGRPVGEWVARLDNAHRGAQYPHININPRISGVPDPHLPVGGTTGLNAGKGVARASKVAGRVALGAAVVLDGIRVGTSVYQDAQNDTSRNTVETVSSVAGGWGGGFGGAAGGAAIGSAIFPGVGTIIGGILGGVAGGLGGSYGAEAIAEEIGDACDYDIEWEKCERCGKRFKYRKYKGGRKICRSCGGH